MLKLKRIICAFVTGHPLPFELSDHKLEHGRQFCAKPTLRQVDRRNISPGPNTLPMRPADELVIVVVGVGVVHRSTRSNSPGVRSLARL
jgi:hypothetical protein